MVQRIVTIYETKSFGKLSKKLLGEEERAGLLEYIKENPKSGDVIQGSGGIRKLRWHRPGTGKRGGVRVIYYFIDAHGIVSLLTIYAKNDKSDLTQKEVKELRVVVDLIKSELDGD